MSGLNDERWNARGGNFNLPNSWSRNDGEPSKHVLGAICENCSPRVKRVWISGGGNAWASEFANSVLLAWEVSFPRKRSLWRHPLEKLQICFKCRKFCCLSWFFFDRSDCTFPQAYNSKHSKLVCFSTSRPTLTFFDLCSEDSGCMTEIEPNLTKLCSLCLTTDEIACITYNLLAVKKKHLFQGVLTCFGYEKKRRLFVFWLFFKIDLCSATSIECFRRDLNPINEFKSILKIIEICTISDLFSIQQVRTS